MPRDHSSTVVYVRVGNPGMAAGIFGGVFAILGTFTGASLFMLLASVCTVIGIFRGLGLLRGFTNISGAGTGASLLAGLLTFIGFTLSPTLLSELDEFGEGLLASEQSASITPKPSNRDCTNVPCGDLSLPSNETALDLRCTPQPTFSGKANNATTYVSVHGTNWSVRHILADGSTVDRSAQYWLRDASKPNAIAWEGTLIGRPQLKMRGELTRHEDDFYYRETQYDSNKRGVKVMDNQLYCTLAVE